MCVQVGCDDLTVTAQLARTGRFLVQVLDVDAGRVDRAREQVHAQGLYGLVSVDRLSSPARLPYAENLVNLLNLHAKQGSDGVSLGEAARVVRPGGIVAVEGGQAVKAALESAGFEEVREVTLRGRWLLARKRWPRAMDQWTHSRYAADGNTVSHDMLAGPPRRVRWVAGPSREDARLISAAGRNFYANLLARDAFNGLRLWERPIKSARQGVPVAAGDMLFAVADKKLLALDGATGETIRQYAEAGEPNDLLVTDGLLVTVDGQSVRAVEVQSARLRWKHEAADPRCVIAGDGAVYLLQGALRRGDKPVAVCLDLASGRIRWQREDYPWISKVRRLVYHQGLVVYEVSTLADAKPDNAIHVASAADGRVLWTREFVPGMNHAKQARAMFIGNSLWVLELEGKCVELDPKTGAVQKECAAGLCHCFPPVATERYMFSGEMELTDLATGATDANRISKAACSRDFGWVPANGLVYVCPKHCVCWPMLRGYVAMAPALPGLEAAKSSDEPEFVLERGVDPPAWEAGSGAEAWSCYRQNAWRSGSTTVPVPARLRPLWTAKLGGWPKGTIVDDWRENAYVHGPITAPTIAGNRVYVAHPDQHQVVALDARTGEVRWRYTANGRVDTPPTIHRGLCLFGSRSGWVYCLRADDGRMVWRLRAAPREERIVAYGQVESAWPVPGSVLVVDGVAYFAAGIQPLAEGGVLVFAVEPSTGQVRWRTRLDSLPIKNYYGSSALEFDGFDLLQQEDDSVAMSRWLFDRATGRMTCKAGDAFAMVKMGGSGVWVPRSSWGYAPRHQSRNRNHTPAKGLAVFRDNTVLGCLDDGRTIYRRDFQPGERFDPTWMTGWKVDENARKGTGEYWLGQRLAEKAAWSLPPYAKSEPKQKVTALVLAGDTLFAAGSEGGLLALSASSGEVLARRSLDSPIWDGMAAAAGFLFVSTQNGEVICLGAE